MSVEDVIRVAQLKLREARLARVAQEAKARAGDIVDVTEYLKPGPEEIFGLLPPRLGRWALARVRRDRAWPLKVTTTRLSGLPAAQGAGGAAGAGGRARCASPRRRRGWSAGSGWSSARSPSARRRRARWWRPRRWCAATPTPTSAASPTGRTIMDGVVEPMLAGRLPRAHFADAVLQARLAASKDPEGEALAADHRRHRPHARPRQDRRGVAARCTRSSPRRRAAGRGRRRARR